MASLLVAGLSPGEMVVALPPRRLHSEQEGLSLHGDGDGLSETLVRLREELLAGGHVGLVFAGLHDENGRALDSCHVGEVLVAEQGRVEEEAACKEQDLLGGRGRAITPVNIPNTVKNIGRKILADDFAHNHVLELSCQQLPELYFPAINVGT